MENVDIMFNNKNIIAKACNIPKDAQAALFHLAVSKVIHKRSGEDIEQLTNFADHKGLTMTDVLDLVGLFIYLVNLYMQTNENQFCSALQDASFTKDFIDNLPLKKTRDLSASLQLIDSNVGGIEKICSFKWRVDISFACGNGARLLPMVVISLKINHRRYILEFDVKQFARLRYYLSSIIKEFQRLKTSAVVNNNRLLVA